MTTVCNTPDLRPLLAEMQDWYEPLRNDRLARNVAYNARRETIWAMMEAFAAAHPDCPVVLQKARLYELIAEHFEPHIFRHSPFYFEMGVRLAESWGVPRGDMPGSWTLTKYLDRCNGVPEWEMVDWFRCRPERPLKVWHAWGGFDSDHHCLGYTKYLRLGIDGVLAEIAAVRAQADKPFLEAAERGCRALLRVAERFAERAEVMLAAETDPEVRGHLERIAATARRVPAQPPRTFYEGLAAILFLREAIASMDNIGISVMGHLDRLLGKLYADDLAAGRITEAEARELIARWLPHTDVRFHLYDNTWPETSSCIELGGCDEDGEPVYNDVTRLVIETHWRERRVNPKLNCRFSEDAPDWYLDLISRCILAGHNNFALLNDGVLIEAAIRAGKLPEHARLYVNGGCQEPMCEGVEHSAGAYWYLNMARVLDLCLQPLLAEDELPSPVLEAMPMPIESAATFEEFYSLFRVRLEHLMQRGAGWLRQMGHQWPEVHPCPLFSTGLTGCIETATDYTAGGALYNPSGVALNGYATVVDSLAAIRRAVYEEGWLTLADLRQALATDWREAEALRSRLAALPKYGHGDPCVDSLAARLANDLAASCANLENERGGRFQPSFFVYYQFVVMGTMTRATPDGRHAGDMLSQGCGPARVRPPNSLTDVIHSLDSVDFANFPGNAVVDVQLPMGGRLNPPTLSAVIRAFAHAGGATLQTNCVRVEDLRAAQDTPAAYSDLVVRISGLSAKFVALEKRIQDEIIDRTVMQQE